MAFYRSQNILNLVNLVDVGCNSSFDSFFLPRRLAFVPGRLETQITADESRRLTTSVENSVSARLVYFVRVFPGCYGESTEQITAQWDLDVKPLQAQTDSGCGAFGDLLVHRRVSRIDFAICRDLRSDAPSEDC